jgi:hypothetical protein
VVAVEALGGGRSQLDHLLPHLRRHRVRRPPAPVAVGQGAGPFSPVAAPEPASSAAPRSPAAAPPFPASPPPSPNSSAPPAASAQPRSRSPTCLPWGDRFAELLTSVRFAELQHC